MRPVARGPLLALALLASACSPSPPRHPLVVAEDGAVRIPASEVTPETVLFRTFEHEGKNVNFLVRRDRRGAIRVHLDACHSCWRYRRGFVVEHQALVCIACRLAYRLEDETWDFIGACAPIPIAFNVAGGEVVVRSAVLERAARFF